MRNYLLCASLFLVVVPPGHAQQEPGKVIKDTWFAAYLEGARCGYFRRTVRETERGGQTFYNTTFEMNLTVKRSRTLINQRMQQGNEETADGKVTSVFFTLFLDKGQPQTLVGEVKDGQLHVRSGAKLLGVRPWNDKALGLYAQDRLPLERKVKPGDTVEFINFEPVLLAPVGIQAHVKDLEEVDVLEVDNKDPDKPTVQRVRTKLLRLEMGSDKVTIDGKAFQIPRMLNWLDKDMQLVRCRMEQNGMGSITLYRTTEAVARQEGAAPALLPDLVFDNLIILNKAIDKVHDSKTAVYRITAKNDDDPQTLFCRDTRQRVLNLKGDTFDLEVKALRGPVTVDNPEQIKDEFLKSSFFLDSDSPGIKELVSQAVGEETDPWKKGLRIEKWVHEKMKLDSGIGFVPASTIAHDRKGDCRQHAMLTAALCRATGVPARTAIGLVYGTDPRNRPVLAFHMWTEVWVQHQWLALDAVLGQGGVGPGHLKITDHSWNDIQTLAPLVPLSRAMSKIKVEVVSVE